MAVRPWPREVQTRAWALLVLVAMVAHTLVKLRAGILPELLWGCNVASFMVLLGLWFDAPILVGPAFLWHLCVGDPAFLVASLGPSHSLAALLVNAWSSVLVHTLPTLAGFFYLRRRGLPPSSPYLALALFVALVPISHQLTPPALNINLAHVRWEPLRSHVPGRWSYRLVFCSGLLFMFLLGDQLGKRVLGRPQPS